MINIDTNAHKEPNSTLGVLHPIPNRNYKSRKIGTDKQTQKDKTKQEKMNPHMKMEKKKEGEVVKTCGAAKRPG